jgi:hypothetical protein
VDWDATLVQQGHKGRGTEQGKGRMVREEVEITVMADRRRRRWCILEEAAR